ncbi:MAG: protein O-mannosyl-transferase family [Bdellovibrionia bacterium]
MKPSRESLIKPWASSLRFPTIFLYFGLLSIIGWIYFISLPLHVQGGDPGELVAAAYRLNVAHPPGYPLWIWLQWVFTHTVSSGTIFWRASVLNSIFALFALGILTYPLRHRILALGLCLFSLGLASCFSEAAVLPDVFSLHSLFIAAIGNLYFFSPLDSKVRSFFIPFLFFLGLAHHQTLIFLFPILLTVALVSRKRPDQKMSFLMGSLFGLTLTLGLYLSLHWMHESDFFSWGNLSNFKAIFRHFLRADYGTFQLLSTVHSEFFGLQGLWFFLQTSGFEILALLGFSSLVAFRSQYQRKTSNLHLLLWLLSLFLSLLFLVVLNVKPEGIGAEVVKRFHVMPLIQIMVVIVHLFSQTSFSLQEKILGPTLVFLSLGTFSEHFLMLKNLHHDAIIEEYAENFLKIAGQHKPTIILQNEDSAYFAIRYLQNVLNREPAIPVISPSLLFHPWYYEKIKNRLPQFQMKDPTRVFNQRELHLTHDLVIPNVQKNVNVFTPNGLEHDAQLKLTYFGLGRLWTQGTGVFFDDASALNLKIQNDTRSPRLRIQGAIKAHLSEQYCTYWLAKANEAHLNGDSSQAMQLWQIAFQTPFKCEVARQNLCAVSNLKHPICGDQRAP